MLLRFSYGFNSCYSVDKKEATEHSANKIIKQSGLFQNEVGPGELQSSI